MECPPPASHLCRTHLNFLLEEHMKRMSLLNAFLAVLCLTISGSVLAQDTDSQQDRNMQQNRTTSDSRSMQERDMHNAQSTDAHRMQVASGQKTKLKGIVLTRDNNNN